MTQIQRHKAFYAALMLTLFLLIATTATALAAGMNGTMRATRDLKAGADECYRTVATTPAGASIMLLGRNESGSWVFVWSDAGDGWAPAGTVAPDGAIGSLPVWNDRFNGATCNTQPPVPQFDSRICGRAGSDTAANTVRWTDIYSTADPDLDTGRSYPPNTALTLNGRDFWGCWVRVRSNTDSGNGWIPVQSLDTRAIMSLPVLVDNSGGCQIVDDQIGGCDNSEESTVGDIRTVNSATIIYREPNTDSDVVGLTVPEDGRVRVVSERPGWVRIRSRYGNGYIQVEKLNPPSAADSQARMVADTNLFAEPDSETTVVGSVAQGTEVTVLAYASGWIKISAPAGEGWVPANTVGRR